jgi:cytochrome c peroxidase
LIHNGVELGARPDGNGSAASPGLPASCAVTAESHSATRSGAICEEGVEVEGSASSSVTARRATRAFTERAPCGYNTTMLRVQVAVAGVILFALAALHVSARQPQPAEVFASRLPRWLPVPTVPADNPISEPKIELGRYLFSQAAVRRGASRRQLYRGARVPDGLAHAVGSTASIIRDRATLTNVAYGVVRWDDRRSSLEADGECRCNQQPIEMGLKGREEQVLRRFTSVRHDVERFRAAFPGDEVPVTLQNIVKAIASFERVLVSGNSPFDRYRSLDDRSALSPAAQRGLALFSSDRLRCGECHGSVNLSGPTIFEGAAPAAPDAFFHDTGVAARPSKFRAPTLRNIAVTAPYMHDGSIGTLRDVVAHYARGGRPREGKSERVAGFSISLSETDDLIAFLESLTDQSFLTNPALGDPH